MDKLLIEGKWQNPPQVSVHDAFIALTYQPILGAMAVVVVRVVVTGAETGQPAALQQQMRERGEGILQFPGAEGASPTQEPSDVSTDGCSAERPDETVLHGVMLNNDDTNAKLSSDSSAA